MQDPVQNRRIMGIGRVNLAAKTVDFYPLGPATQVGFAMAPDRKRAYGLMQRNRPLRVLDVRPREKQAVPSGTSSRAGRAWRCETSSNGKVLYVYNAGATIDLYDAATYQVPAARSRSTAT